MSSVGKSKYFKLFCRLAKENASAVYSHYKIANISFFFYEKSIKNVAFLFEVKNIFASTENRWGRGNYFAI